MHLSTVIIGWVLVMPAFHKDMQLLASSYKGIGLNLRSWSEVPLTSLRIPPSQSLRVFFYFVKG